MGKLNWTDYITEDVKKKKKEIEQNYGKYATVHTSKRETPKLADLYKEMGLSDSQVSSKGTIKENETWDNEYLEPLPIKQYGRSFKDKLTNIFGGDEWAAQDFRRFMQYREINDTINKHKAAEAYTKWENARKKSLKEGPKLREKEEARKKQFAEFTGGKYALNSGRELGLEERQLPGSFGQKAAPSDPQTRADFLLQEYRKGANPDYSAANAVLSGPKSEHDERNAFEKVMDFLNSPLKAVDKNILRPAERFATNFTDGVVLGQLKKNIDKNDTPEFVRQAAEEPTNGAEKATDVLGEFAGMAAPIGLAYKPATWLAKGAYEGVKGQKYLEAALRGGLAMGTFSGAQQGVDELTNPEDGDFNSRTKNVLLNAGLGALGDPALLAAGVGLKAGTQNVLGRLAKVDGELPSYNGQVADSILERLAPSRQANIPQNSSAAYDDLIRNANPGARDNAEVISQVQQQKQLLGDEFIAQEIFGKNGPEFEPIARQLLNEEPQLEALVREKFNQTPQAKQLDDILNQLTGEREDLLSQTPGSNLRINNWQNNVTKPRAARPQTQTPDEVIDSVVHDPTAEQAFIDQELAPFYESAQRQAEAKDTFNLIGKQAKTEIERIKGTYGKIKATRGEGEDYPIPPQFRAGVNNMGFDDIHSFATQEGFDTVDQAVQYLKQLDQASKLKLKDLMPEDNYVLSGDEWEMLEQAARDKFKSTQIGPKPKPAAPTQKPAFGQQGAAIGRGPQRGPKNASISSIADNILNQLSGKAAPVPSVKPKKSKEEMLNTLQDFFNEADAPKKTSPKVETIKPKPMTKTEIDDALRALDINDAYLSSSRTKKTITDEKFFKKKQENEVKRQALLDENKAYSSDIPEELNPTWNNKTRAYELGDYSAKKAYGGGLSVKKGEKTIGNFRTVEEAKRFMQESIATEQGLNVQFDKEGILSWNSTYDETTKKWDIQAGDYSILREGKDKWTVKKGDKELGTFKNEKKAREVAQRNFDSKKTETVSENNPAPAAEVPTKEQVDTYYSDLTEEANRLVQEKPDGFAEQLKFIGEEINLIEEARKTGDNSLLLKLNLQQFGKPNQIKGVQDLPTTTDSLKKLLDQDTYKTLWQDTKTHVSSDLQFVKNIMRDIAKQDMGATLSMMGKKGKDVAFEDNLFKGLRAVRRSISMAMKASKEDYGQIIKTLQKNKISKRDFDEFALNVHFADILKNNREKVVRKGEVDKRLMEIELESQATTVKKDLKKLADEEAKLLKEKETLEPYTIPKDVTPQTIKEVLNKWSGNIVMRQAQKDFIAAQRKDLQMQVESGLLSPEAMAAMVKTHPNYVYMGRAKDDGTIFGAAANISRTKQYIKKRTTGSEEDLKLPPLDAAVRNRILTYHNVTRNNAMKTIEKLASTNGGHQYFIKLNPHSASATERRNTVKFFVDGKQELYNVPPVLRQAFDSLDEKSATNLVARATRAASNMIRKGGTYYNLDFIFTSPARETNALITSRTGLHPGELVLGYMDSFMGKGLEKISGGTFKSYRDVYEKMGGHQTGIVTQDPQSLKAFTKAMNKGKMAKGFEMVNPLEWISKVGGLVEHGPKLGEFRSAKNKGYSDADAMHEAVDVIDYSDLGSTTRAVNKYVPFAGPMVRGTTRFFQAAKENPGAWLGKNLMYVTAPTLGIYAMRFAPWTTEEQRSKIRNMSDWQKNLTWAIPKPDGKGVWLVPKMHVGAQIFANPLERTLDKMYDQDPKSVSRIFKDTGKDVGNILTPPNSVAGLQLIMDSMANYNRLMNMPIEDAAMQKNPYKEENFNSYTSEVAKTIGKYTKKSPAKIDYILKGLTAGTGRDVLDLSDNVLAKLGVDRPKKTDTNWDILNPTRRYNLRDDASLGTGTRLRKAWEVVEHDRSAYRKETGERTAPKTRVNEMYDANRDMNKAIKGIREDKKLSSSQKKKMIAEIRALQRQLGDDALKEGILKEY